MLEKNYTLEWLDFIINVTLNDAKTDVSTLSSKQLETIVEKAQEEKDRHISFLKHQSFNLDSRRKIQLLIRQYHASLVMLLDQAYENTSRTQNGNSMLRQALESISASLDELLGFVENRFHEYLSLDERAPAAYLSQVKREMLDRLELLRQELFVRVDNRTLTDIVLQSLNSFIYDSEKRPISFREVFYKKELLAGLEKISQEQDQTTLHGAVVELLVYLNFNSRSFMNYYTQKLAQKINAFGAVHEKMTELLLSYKQFNQMHRKPTVKLNPHHADLKKVLGNWFAQEITYLEKKHQWDVLPLQNQQQPSKAKSDPFKIMCFLSVDQIALTLRAMDATRVVKAKSLNAVIQTIAPYLSTPRKEDLSQESMRNKSYAFEQADKAIVIRMLEGMINWIKEY
ncbi:hypothetical protein GCM10010967_47170 [Dyadobacter beijingensis]|uniref:Uncharacterized protein n=1 Tax=Dyadobacter beijingensis TaxID=365489 RepID=A0ABQ2ICR6_9BACT|nr:hypothetical protein [Dyadobacter beijingensis]GGN06472.1 hypothetical protein GCM10010967_47170 [Dyadobacter beijingensis]